MIKFNVPYKNEQTFPCKAKVLFQKLCTQVGLVAGNIDFINCDYMILGNPFTNNEDCRTVLSNLAQLAGGFAKIGRDNKVYIKTLKSLSNLLTVKYVNAMTVKELNLTIVKALSSGKDNADEQINGHNYYTDFSKNEQWGELNSLVLGLSNIEGENTALDDKASIKENGLTEIQINDNYFLTDKTEREKVIVPIWNALKGIKYLPFKTNYYGYPYLDCGDLIYIQDTKDVGYVSYVLNHTFKFNGGFSGTLETPALTKTQTAYKNTFDVKTRFLNTERKIDKINGIIEDVIEEVDDNTSKLSQHTQTIDSMKDTLKSQETKIETVGNKADNAQSTANTATTKANNAQTSANNAQTTANTANTNAQNAQKTANANTTKITTNTTKIAEVEKTVDGITQSVSAVEEKVETVESTANTANSKIDNLKIGGRNFLTNTATGKNISVNKSSGYVVFDPYSTNNKQTLADLGLKSGDKVTISFDWNISKNGSLDNVYGNFRLEWMGVSDTSQNTYIGLIKNPVATFSSSNMSGKVAVTVTLTDTTVNAHTVRIRIDNSVLTFFVSKMKLELGNTNTDWSPAPEDIENNLATNYYTKTETNSQIQQKADSITSTVTKQISTAKEEAIDSANTSTDDKLKEYSTTAEMNSTITQTANEINLKVEGKLDEKTFTGANIMLAINNDSSSAVIDADKISLSGKNIDLTSDNMSIESTNFKVDKDGNMECNDAKINGGEIILSAATKDTIKMTIKNTDETINTEIAPANFRCIYNGRVLYWFNGSVSSIGNINGNRCLFAGNKIYIEDNVAGSGNYPISLMGDNGNITCTTLTQTSKAEQKKNFEKMAENALDIIKSIDIYKYNLKNENDTDKKHLGFVIGEGYNYSEEVTSVNNDGVDNYSFTSLCCKAIQEQQKQIEQLQEKDKQKDEIISDLIKRIETLEKGASK